MRWAYQRAVVKQCASQVLKSCLLRLKSYSLLRRNLALHGAFLLAQAPTQTHPQVPQVEGKLTLTVPLPPKAVYWILSFPPMNQLLYHYRLVVLASGLLSLSACGNNQGTTDTESPANSSISSGDSGTGGASASEIGDSTATAGGTAGSNEANSTPTSTPGTTGDAGGTSTGSTGGTGAAPGAGGTTGQ